MAGDVRKAAALLPALVIALAAAFPAVAQDQAQVVVAETRHIVHNSSRGAYAQPFAGLSVEQRQLFSEGRQVFQRSWVVAPSSDEAFDGLGPLHNRLACISCHPNHGRGLAPALENQRMLSMAVRLSIAGHGAFGEPLPHPVYGDQLNEESVPGVPAEGRAALHWTETEFVFADGEVVSLRSPQTVLSQLNYGEADDAQLSPRVGPALVAPGLLEAVPEDVIQAIAAEEKPDGVSGIANRVWDTDTRQYQLGRFGFKASVASLRTQIAQAMHTDLSIRSSLFPDDNCTAVQLECLAAVEAENSDGHELTDTQLEALTFYLQHLAVPARRDRESEEVQKGEKLFSDIGCALCHRPQLPVASHVSVPFAYIEAYTDLLLHDMGPGLAVENIEYLASGSHWRTAPLWGLGLVSRVGDEEQYLHDGRARSLTEAVLWHDGEASVARGRFAELSPAERQSLLVFLKSL